jgi:hypothetical protein
MRGKVNNDDRSDRSQAYALFPGDVAYVWVPAGPTQFEFWRTLTGSGFDIPTKSAHEPRSRLAELQIVARAAPDGYTLLLTGANDSVNTVLYDNLHFDYLRDIVPVESIMHQIGVLSTASSPPFLTASFRACSQARRPKSKPRKKNGSPKAEAGASAASSARGAFAIRRKARRSGNPSEYYFRTAPFFETASEKYGWLNRIVTIATGHRLPDGPVYHVFKSRMWARDLTSKFCRDLTSNFVKVSDPGRRFSC